MSYDAIIIGAGHNGLVAAAYLARSGKSVLVLERRGLPGGSLVTEDFGGFQADSLQSGSLRPDIVRDLKLDSHGLPAGAASPAFVSLLGDSDGLRLDANPVKAAESIRRFSAQDANRWPDFVTFMNKAAGFLESAYNTVIPPLPKPGWDGLYDLTELALDLRLSGRRDMLNIIRALGMSALELTEEYFESDVVRAAVASLGIHNLTLGPLSAGTSLNLIHNWLNRSGLAHRHTGQAGRMTEALMQAAKAFGAEIRLNAEVKRVFVRDLRATGVELADGEGIEAAAVLSAVDPKRTFLSLVGPLQLPPEFVWGVQSIKMRGSVAKVHLGLESLPEGLAPDTTYAVAPSINYLERAYEAAKYGEVSEHPYLELTASGNVLSIHFQFAPYALKHGDWETERPRLERLGIDTLAEYFPDLKPSIKNLKSLTPLDLETTYGLTEGDPNHGQLLLDQSFFMRPIPGFANHKTPIDGLYLCGSGVHGGGGVSGIAGRNVVKALKL